MKNKSADAIDQDIPPLKGKFCANFFFDDFEGNLITKVVSWQTYELVHIPIGCVNIIVYVAYVTLECKPAHTRKLHTKLTHTCTHICMYIFIHARPASHIRTKLMIKYAPS